MKGFEIWYPQSKLGNSFLFDKIVKESFPEKRKKQRKRVDAWHVFIISIFGENMGFSFPFIFPNFLRGVEIRWVLGLPSFYD